MEKVAFLFPGQGSQAVGMGRTLVQRFARARAVFDEADAVLDTPLSRLCFDGPAESLALTENTQPALLTHSWALCRVLEEELGVRPSWTAGHSLGEFSALVAAGSIAFADALRLVRERGRAMQEAVPVGQGTMAVILGLEPATVDQVCAEAAQGQVVSAANLNGAGQVVIAGNREAVDRASEIAKGRGAKRVLPLTVSAPFHCALMEPAARRLAAALQGVEIEKPRIPVLSNVAGDVYADAAAVRELLVRQVVSPVRWQDCVARLGELGCRRALEVGPGKVLSGLVKRIVPDITCIAAEDVDSVRQALAA